MQSMFIIVWTPSHANYDNTRADSLHKGDVASLLYCYGLLGLYHALQSVVQCVVWCEAWRAAKCDTARGGGSGGGRGAEQCGAGQF